ncbi:hypothetical protein J3R30DRAFT_3450660 [Lentinula aciculospora]|uniref:O-fucosyltransferase family protein n=1 Tax=Lentinula aciculospora TaxID=153920 RepID=A0A9W9AK24_9AGAR|nr:hypothetical protein J3R30DRAFT_3450660 [Lentinula aciculospora]
MAVPAFRLTARAREASTSPSVSLEKGRHRISAPRTPIIPEAPLLASSRTQPASVDRNNLYLAVLVSLLAFACFACFGTAYYLYKFRWSLSLEVGPLQADEIFKVIEVDPHIEDCPHIDSRQQKYLSYLPHSGFHNQRIALENALTLSGILNRTLLVPPIRLGSKPLRYVNYDSLYSFVSLSGKENLTHCSKSALDVPLSSECFDYFDYTFLSWEWLVHFSEIRARQLTISRWNLTDAWMHHCLNITFANTRTIKDPSRYQFRFVDNASTTKNAKFSEDLQIDALASFSEPLLQIGTLFGSSRLHLSAPENRHARSRIRKHMVLQNPYLLHAAELVAMALGHSYLAVHVRLGDGQFRAQGEAKARSVWRSLLRDELRIPVADAVALERSVGKPIEEPLPFFDQFMNGTDTSLRCRSSYHTQPHLIPLNVPLYIATDAKDPAANPDLAVFFRTFPCAFHLGDFLGHLDTLDHLENLYDGLKLKPFLIPFLDAMIAGKSSRAIGTPGSTFSTYVTDVLWPKYHHLEISERG